MKKLIYGGLFLAFAGLSLQGCKKQPIETTADQKVNSSEKTGRYSTDGTMLIFANSGDFEATVTDLTDIKEQALTADLIGMSYTSYNEELINQGTGATDLIGDAILNAVLNKERIVQIGAFLYRINKQTDKVFVLPLVNKSEYADLVAENKANTHIRQFSTSDDVIELAESGAEGEKCSESGSSGKSNTQSVDYVDISGITMHLTAIADYNNWGIVHSLVARFSRPGPTTSNQFHLWIQTEATTFKKKCSTSYGPTTYPWVNDFETYRREQRYRPYYGTKALSHFHFKIRGRMEESNRPQGGNPYTTVFTPWAEINN